MTKEDLNFFLSKLNVKLTATNHSTELLRHNTMSNGVENFEFKNWQIGRVYFGKRTSKMQILTEDSVVWIENKTLAEYVENIDKWISYIDAIENSDKQSEKEVFGIFDEE